MSDETVGFVADPSHLDRFLPRVIKNGERNQFRKGDMKRVLDFDNVPDPPTGGAVMYCEDGGPEGLKFHVRHMVLRGGFLFYYDVQDVFEEEGDVEYWMNRWVYCRSTRWGSSFLPVGDVSFENMLIQMPGMGTSLWCTMLLMTVTMKRLVLLHFLCWKVWHNERNGVLH